MRRSPRHLGIFTAEIAPRVAPVLTLARDDAASDPEVARTLEQIGAARLDRMTINAHGLFEAWGRVQRWSVSCALVSNLARCRSASLPTPAGWSGSPFYWSIRCS